MKRKDKGGVSITKAHGIEMTNMSEDTARSILHEYKISNADVNFKCNATIDDLIDIIEGNRIYVPCIYVLNKIDSISI
jgi:ribosome-interacting GTPase 1